MNIETWKTVCYFFWTAFGSELKDKGVYLGWNGEALLNAVPFALPWTKYHLARVTGKDIGISGEASFSEVCLRAKCHYLHLCPPHVVPLLVTQLLGNTSTRERLNVGMKPIRILGADRHPKYENRIFQISCHPDRVNLKTEEIVDLYTKKFTAEDAWIFLIRAEPIKRPAKTHVSLAR